MYNRLSTLLNIEFIHGMLRFLPENHFFRRDWRNFRNGVKEIKNNPLDQYGMMRVHEEKVVDLTRHIYVSTDTKAWLNTQ